VTEIPRIWLSGLFWGGGKGVEDIEASAEERAEAGKWLQGQGLESLLEASAGEQQELREDKCREVLAGQSSRFRVTYEVDPVVIGRRVRVVEVAVPGDEPDTWEPRSIPAVASGLKRLGIGVAIDQMKQSVRPMLVPTSLDVTAGFLGMWLQPKKLVAKVMGIAVKVVVLHLGWPPLVAGWIGSGVERLCSSLQESEGMRGTAAEECGPVHRRVRSGGGTCDADGCGLCPGPSHGRKIRRLED